jgi:DNA-binding PucR family transcriptional regulator
VRTRLREESNATHAAKSMFTHRNTVLNRLARAHELLPAPLACRGLQVGLALEVVGRLGPPRQASSIL